MANRYWVGGAGTWDGSTATHWSATSGGAGGAVNPTDSDAVHFDANSGGGAVILASGHCASLDCTGFTGTFTNSTGTVCAGNIILGGSNFGTISQTGDGTLTSNGFRCGMLVGGATTAHVTLLDDALFLQLTVTNGSLDANGHNAVVQGACTVNASGTLTMGSGNWTFTGSGLVFRFDGGHVTSGTSTVIFSDPVAGQAQSMLGNQTVSPLYNVTLGSRSVVTITTVDIAGTLSFVAGAVLSVTTDFGINVQTLSFPGAGNWVSIRGGTIDSLSGGAMALSYCVISDTEFGNGTWTATNSVDIAGNSGITITGPTGSGNTVATASFAA